MPNDAPRRRRPFVPPVALVNTALRLRRFLLRAADAVVPPYLAVFDRFMGAGTTALVHSAARLEIADHLARGPLTVEELATRTDTAPEYLERAMRALVATGVFRRDPDGRFANNRVSSAMITGADENIRGFAEFFGMKPVLDAWTALPETLRDGKVGFERVHGRSAWEWISGDDRARAAFVEGMSSMTAVIAPAIAAAYPFHEVQTVCDVGGGVGIILAEALNQHAHLRGVLFDDESMLKEAPPFLAKRGVAERVDLVSGSFLEAVPRGADAYILKTVLHNWDDDRAGRILKNVRAAMDPGHRLLVADFLDEADHLSTLVPFMDFAGMMVYNAGRERSPGDMERLFANAGFRLGRVIPLPGCQAIFEGVAH